MESILCSRNALGVELNPVARLVAKVKITPLDGAELARAVQEFWKKANRCGFVMPPEFPNRDHWFSAKVQNELAKIKYTIDNMDVDLDIHDFFIGLFFRNSTKSLKCGSTRCLPTYDKAADRT